MTKEKDNEDLREKEQYVSRKSETENGSGTEHPERAGESKGKEFPVVGVGASAGGLEALKSFFSAVSENSGMAYIVLIHTKPDQPWRPNCLEKSPGFPSPPPKTGKPSSRTMFTLSRPTRRSSPGTALSRSSQKVPPSTTACPGARPGPGATTPCSLPKKCRKRSSGFSSAARPQRLVVDFPDGPAREVGREAAAPPEKHGRSVTVVAESRAGAVLARNGSDRLEGKHSPQSKAAPAGNSQGQG